MKMMIAPAIIEAPGLDQLDFAPVAGPLDCLQSTTASAFHSYFANLHQLILAVEVSDKNRSFSPQEGTEKARAAILASHARAGKVMIVGNGGSASIASHMALDLWKACGIKAIVFNDSAQLTCLGNDFGYEHVFSKAVEMFAHEEDVLVAISSSGKSQNILNAVKTAKEKNVSVITYSGFDRNAPLLSAGDLNFYIDSDQYGLVEVAHMALIHQLTDTILEHNRK